MNLAQCRRCQRDVPVESRYATNKRFCSKDCYDTWWSEFRSRRVTVGELTNKLFGEAPTVELNEGQKIWLAALIDGEGWIGIVKERKRGNASGFHYKPGVEITNTNRALLESAAGHLDAIVYIKDNRPSNPKHKPHYSLRFKTRAISSFLKQIKPYLVVKGRQAEIVLEFCKVKAETPMRTSQNADIFESLRNETRSLNRKGTALATSGG